MTFARILRGEVLLDDVWLRERIADTGRRWSCSDDRVNATLWWYSASSVLMGPAAEALLTTGRVPKPFPDRLTLRTTGHVGYLEHTWSTRIASGPEAFGASLPDELGPVIDRLAHLGGATTRSLWSVLADSLAGRLLAAETLDLPALSILTARIVAAAGGVLPQPRYACTTPRPHSYVRRGSCCLIYQAPGHGRCANCPRQTPVVRNARVLATHA